MRFYLQRESEFICLEQLLKATGTFDDYFQIRAVIEHGKVSVNGDVTKSRRKMVRAGDVVRYRDNHIMVMSPQSRPKFNTGPKEPDVHVTHGQGPQKWVEKKLKPVKKRES
jgi:ribosome-associated protein YbcJ (S4-like RNA binding protein)